MLAHFVSQALRDGIERNLPLAVARRVRDDDAHLDAAVGWLMASIQATGGHAAAKAYRFALGWMAPYPEASGYILCTLLELARQRGEPHLRETARTIGDWLVSIQFPDGGFVGRELGVMDTPVVFNTAMVMLGLNALDREFGDGPYRDAAGRAAAFLMSCQDESGCFVRFLSNDIVHTYNVRAAWPMLEYAELAGRPEFARSAGRALDWSLAQQTEGGFFRNNQFKPGGNANTHGLAFVLEGLLEAHALTGRDELVAATLRTADRLVELYDANGWIAADLGEDWRYLSRHICLTGYAQLALSLFKLYPHSNDERHLALGQKLLADACHHQTWASPGKPWHGGLKGSFPIYGRYAPLQYPSWAAKFLIDALLEKRRVMAVADASGLSR